MRLRLRCCDRRFPFAGVFGGGDRYAVGGGFDDALQVAVLGARLVVVQAIQYGGGSIGFVPKQIGGFATAIGEADHHDPAVLLGWAAADVATGEQGNG